MNAFASGSRAVREKFVAELSDAALVEVSRHEVRGTSIEQELALWKALAQTVSRCGEKLRARVHSGPVACDEFAAELAEAAYGVTLAHGFRGSFLDVRMGLWKALRRALRESRLAEAFVHSLGSRGRELTPA